MWRRLVNWYDEMENEQLAVLLRPELAADSPAGWRRWTNCKLAALSPIERMQLHEFCTTYRGPRLWKALGKFFAFFTFAGVHLHLAFDKTSWAGSILIANLVGFGLLVSCVGAWFNSGEIMRAKRKVMLGAVAGALLGALGAFSGLMLSDARPVADIVARLPKLFIATVLAGMVIAMPMFLVGAFRRQQHKLLAEQLQRDAERERLARELSESQLRMLRAQIEPHFLFNTLGAVQQLAADGAPRAAELTADLIAFLRASFSDMRAEQVSLANEFTTIASYLRVMQARLGARLRFELSLPEALSQVDVPSMIALTLVENAIKHGIEPSLRGGEIRVRAREEGGSLLIFVHDSGVGMSATPGNGTGLDNVRRRLQLAYGDRAGLELRELDPGLAAELRLPLQMPMQKPEAA
jgi:signal transduction histidine kinase